MWNAGRLSKRSLDPGTWSTGYTGASFGGGVYSNLVEILPDGSVAGELAESWDVEPGAKVWRFKLRGGITFHDGKSLTVEDVKQSLLHHMKPDSSSGARAIVQQIESIEADGDRRPLFLHSLKVTRIFPICFPLHSWRFSLRLRAVAST